MSDNINSPKHYTSGKYEVVDILEGMNMTDFREANILKYMFRYKHKGTPLADLQKAEWYLKRLINKIKEDK